ncbi:MAG: Mur ligase family protein, partial [Thermodesulfovibrionales bacterium]
MIKGKKITVVGLARSGAGAAKLLARMGAEVTVTDKRPEVELIDMVTELGPSVKLALGGHPEEVFSDADLIVVSPGVPLEIRPIVSAKAKGIPVIGELELAFQIIEGSRVKGQGPRGKGPEGEKPIPFLAITGSNGKSTTTTLLNHMMRKAGFNTMLGGNIGNALTEEILKAIESVKSNMKGNEYLAPCPLPLSNDYVVVEVSSFQLEAIDSFRP